LKKRNLISNNDNRNTNNLNNNKKENNYDGITKLLNISKK